MGRCNCDKTIAKLKSLGAIHAAYMHEMGAGLNPNQWTPEDWRSHMMEEEILLFPRFPALLRVLLISHHQAFRNQLSYRGMIDPDLMEEHSRLEDAAVEAYIP
jgi:hypothetical protein